MIQLSIPGTGEKVSARVWADPGVPPKGAGIVFVSGVNGQFEQPVDGIYERIARKLAPLGVPSIHVDYRQPGYLQTSVEDAKAAAARLLGNCVDRLALIGWSFGGAVITNTAVEIPQVLTVIGFAPQGEQTEPVAQFKPKQSILLFHSILDENVEYDRSSPIIMNEAPANIIKVLNTITEKSPSDENDSDHLLLGFGPQIDPKVMEWLDQKLIAAERPELGSAGAPAPTATPAATPDSNAPNAPAEAGADAGVDSDADLEN